MLPNNADAAKIKGHSNNHAPTPRPEPPARCHVTLIGGPLHRFRLTIPAESCEFLAISRSADDWPYGWSCLYSQLPGCRPGELILAEMDIEIEE